MTPNQVIAEHNWNYRRESIIELAEAWGKANKSDPFAAQRALTHLRNGVADLTSYQVVFGPETRTTATGAKYTVQVPRNLARP